MRNLETPGGAVSGDPPSATSRRHRDVRQGYISARGGEIYGEALDSALHQFLRWCRTEHTSDRGDDPA